MGAGVPNSKSGDDVCGLEEKTAHPGIFAEFLAQRGDVRLVGLPRTSFSCTRISPSAVPNVPELL